MTRQEQIQIIKDKLTLDLNKITNVTESIGEVYQNWIKNKLASLRGTLQTSAEQTSAEQTSAEQTSAEQTSAEQTNTNEGE